jgi:subtilisin family serine protease
MTWGADLIGTEDFYKQYLADKDLPEVRIAVIDTGINEAPALFKDRILPDGVNYSSSGNDSVADDLNHGTHVTGTICELTPSNVKILPIKSFDRKGHATDEQIYAGIMYALENDADVLNMSFGGLGVNPLEVEAMMIAEKNGIICCAAAGNNADDARYYYPSSIKSCITVAAVNNAMTRAEFSNFGDMIDVSAPGVGIVSYGIEGADQKISKDGTSMATPHVTACCALLRSYDKEMSADRAERLLTLNATDLGEPGFDKDTGWGLVCMKGSVTV